MTMELFDKKFVYFEWNDILKGKKGFFATDISTLRVTVDKGSIDVPDVIACVYSSCSKGSPSRPFHSERSEDNWTFFYYDPNYECKRAYNEGEQIQFESVMPVEPVLSTGCIVYFDKSIKEMNIINNGLCVGDECIKLFEGPYEKCRRWVEEHEKFRSVMVAHYCDGKRYNLSLPLVLRNGGVVVPLNGSVLASIV